ncbi:MAG: hypothetical protein WC879_03465 [Melioribacteraceae bacterium]
MEEILIENENKNCERSEQFGHQTKVKSANDGQVNTKEFIIKYFGLPEDVNFNKIQKLTYSEIEELIDSRLSV